MKTRTDLLNHLAEKYNLQRYLEIGVQVPSLNFDKIKCRDKVGVDPDPKANAIFNDTSDRFFETILQYPDRGAIQLIRKLELDSVSIGSNGLPEISSRMQERYTIPTKYNLIFIDGLHTAEQVKKDFENSLKVLSPNGFIVLHDCNPLKEEHTIVPRPSERGHWNGDVYKFAFAFYESPHVYTVDIDNGCMVIQKKEGLRWKGVEYLNWDFFDENRKELLNLITWDEFVNL